MHLKGIQLRYGWLNDSSDISNTYLHIANAFVQSGFVDEAEKYINLSIEFDSTNIFSAYVKPIFLCKRYKSKTIK